MDFSSPKLKQLIQSALEEDISTGDVTSLAIFDAAAVTSARIVAKQDGIVCGTEMVKLVYMLLGTGVECEIIVPDGKFITTGTTAIRIKGPTKTILEGERTALNFFQRMSGIATKTAELVQLVSQTSIKIIDTRKTLPGFRLLDKYSVVCGGGTNHRIGLYDMVLIKDNHIKAAGSVRKAVEKVRAMWGNRYKVETEASDLAEVQEALQAGSDIILLDNMDKETMRSAISLIGGKAKIELSGNMNAGKINSLLDLQVDYISVGALTHSVIAFDWSMKFD